MKDATLQSYAARLDTSLDQLLARAPTCAEGIKLQRAIKKGRRHLLVLVTNRDLPPTNNGSEPALCPCAVFRKIANGFRTQWGARLYADIRAVLETARRLTLAGKLLPMAARQSGGEQLLIMNGISAHVKRSHVFA